ncbi:Venom serine carboxypeptidase [Pseudolycoriella hygida]|uniref:Venom serine carboxypeptidase n=1 Tax=Pseudolycoriella hygida TaxID=35572 RepID=A0A9Q0NFR2_9DIPT|nr:Venom serine carboxypeptidase [Pseudolycoriella hygida]
MMANVINFLFVWSSIFIATKCFDGDYDQPLFLSEFIDRGDYSSARNFSQVRHKEMEWLTSYAGYFTINRQLGSNMFFWFFPAKCEASTAPLVLWLEGGPGTSSMLGLFRENGPFLVDADGMLRPREYSWHLQHNLLYIDNPVGTGYSFTAYDAGYSKNQNDIGAHLYNVLQQFLLVFPELRENPFYITGSSYGGKFALALGHTILKNSPTFNSKNRINLQGLAIGSGFIDPVNMLNYGDILYQNGMIDSNGLKIFKEYEKDMVECINKRDYAKALFHIDRLILNLLYKSDTVFTNLTGSTNIYDAALTEKYDFTFIEDFLSRPDVKVAIHVGDVEFQSDQFNNVDLREEDRPVQFFLRRDIMQSVTGWLVELLKHYKVFLFNGQTDIIGGYTLTENFLKQLKFGGAEEYKEAERHIWKVDNEIAGYVKQAGRLTEIVVHNAGHYVGMDRPKWVLEMLTKLTSGKGFRFD